MSTDADRMPVFEIKGKDKLALETIAAYRLACIQTGLSAQVREVDKAMREMWDWQQRNPSLMKFPDHKHVPVTKS